MSRRVVLFLLLSLECLSAAAAESVTTIAFGSCLKQWKEQPVWEAVASIKPDVFLFIGDNVYADTTDVKAMRSAYRQLGAQPGYQRLKELCPVHATWDDHDYGASDAGADYPMRTASEQIFLDFFRVPKEAPERARPGVYSEHTFGPPDKRVQIIMLDTRFFRSPLKRAVPSADCPRVNFAPNTDLDATILGVDQWQWLEQRLRRPARLRIIASSIQVIPDEHCYEKWANFPNERDRLFQLLAGSGASGVILISGDRHLAEISRFDIVGVGYPLYEVTSSGMNSAGAGKGERNRFRVHRDNFRGDNFGLIQVEWTSPEPRVRLQVRDVHGRVAQSHEVPLSDLAARGPVRD